MKSYISLLILIIFLITFGTLGFMYLEELSFVDAIYATIYTLTTTGYENPATKTSTKILSMILIILGIFTFFYAIPIVISPIVERKIKASLGLKKVNLKNHVVISRFNVLSETIVETLKRYKVDYIVIENREDRIRNMVRKNINFIFGDPKESISLENANIKEAKSLILTSKNDAENIYVIIAAKEINPDILIYSIVRDPENKKLYKKLGVKRAVDPWEISIKAITESATKPYVIDFLEKVTLSEGVHLEQFKVPEFLIGKRIFESKIREKTNGASIVAIFRDGNIILNPCAEEFLKRGDILLLMGNEFQIKKAEKYLGVER